MGDGDSSAGFRGTQGRKDTRNRPTMESIKNKMEALVKEKEEATKKAEGLEGDRAQLDAKYANYDKQINEVNKKIASLEDELDNVITSTVKANESLDSASKTANDSELEVSALVRRVQLLEEETSKVTARLDEVLDKLSVVEKEGDDHERHRNILEGRSFQNEEKIELNESQVEEAKTIAEESDRKFEEISRKLKIVENDLERMVDRYEEQEHKIAECEIKLDADRIKLKEYEELAAKNTDQVDKLESNIDILQDSLFAEKASFIDLSKKLDETL